MRMSDWSADVCSSDLPRVTALARSAMLAADLVLVPVQPSPLDVWASSEIVALVNEARLFKPWLRAAFVVHRCVVRTLIGRELRGALAEAVAQPRPVMATAVRQRIVFAEARSEEHTSELPSLMRNHYDVFCF